MIKLKSILENNSGEFTNITKRQFIKLLYKKLTPHINGIFYNNNWKQINHIFKIFDSLNLNWHVVNVYYGNAPHDKTFPPERKVWNFNIKFVNKNNKVNIIHGNIIAAGAGTVEDPLSKYDIVVILS